MTEMLQAKPNERLEIMVKKGKKTLMHCKIVYKIISKPLFLLILTQIFTSTAFLEI